jgi:hypothetical protein
MVNLVLESFGIRAAADLVATLEKRALARKGRTAPLSR